MTNPFSATPGVACHVCGAVDLEVAEVYSRFQRVTSDCKPWPPGGRLARCRGCGSVQSLVTADWRREAEAIYAGYTIYEQGGGAEQQVFSRGHGAGQPRSERILARLLNEYPLPSHGRLLDIGCGNGSFLSAWSRALPGWALHGTEVSPKHQRDLERIPGFGGLFTGDLEEVPGRFDVISLVHVLEHIPDPVAFLTRCREKLDPRGRLIVEVPDCMQHPFMLLVADHCSHFSTDLLAGIVAAAAFDVRMATNQWVMKEISVVAEPGSELLHRTELRLPVADGQEILAGCQPLEAIVAAAAPLARQRPFGIFGTAIAATWLDAELGGAAQFFVDEDLSRIGKRHLGRPILAPAAVPERAVIYVALPQPLAGEVTQRLTRLGRDFRVEQP
jgi:SAM-dependent methyltransferase